MNMLVILDNSPQGRWELSSIDCKSCGFRFYADTISIRGLLHNNGMLTCPSCRNTFQLKQFKLEGSVKTRKVAPAQNPRTTVTDETPVEPFKAKKPGTPIDGGIRFAPARTKITIADSDEVILRELDGGGDALQVKESYEPFDYELLIRSATALGLDLEGSTGDLIDEDFDWGDPAVQEVEEMRRVEQAALDERHLR
jgi:hypothetical protein